MKRTILAVALMSVAGLSATALGDGRVTIVDSYGAYNGPNPGGPFKYVRAAPGTGFFNNGDDNGIYGGNRIEGASGNDDGRDGEDSFLGFCVEYNEHINLPGGPYYTQISESSRFGGVSGGNPDPISGTTAKIYREFRGLLEIGATGNVDTSGKFNNLLGSTLSAGESGSIQQAIWFEEGEQTLAEIGGTGGLAWRIWDWAKNNNDGGLHGVRVLRLWQNFDSRNSNNGDQGYSGQLQDQLTCIPLPPAGWAGIGSLAGVLGFGVIRRRRLAAL